MSHQPKNNIETTLKCLLETDCVQVDQEVHVKLLFYKSSPFPLPQWFRHESDCYLSRKSMMQNFPNYIKLEGEGTFNILEELKELTFKKKRIFSSSVIRYSFFLRYTSLQTYRLLMKEFPFSSFPLLKNHWRTTWCCQMCKFLKIARGDFQRCSIDVWWHILQTCEEYFGGKIIGANESNKLIKDYSHLWS